MKAAGASEKVLALLPHAEKSVGGPKSSPGADPAFDRLANAAEALHTEDYAAAEKYAVRNLSMREQTPEITDPHLLKALNS